MNLDRAARPQITIRFSEAAGRPRSQQVSAEGDGRDPS
jgi:hypothetical protein